MRDVFIIKYGELWLKSEYVRKSFAKRLAENIRRMLKARKIVFKLERSRDMLILETENSKASEVLERVFGISWFAKAKETKSGMKSIEKASLTFARKIGKKQSFAVRASRSDKSTEFSSKDIENEIGKKIRRKVDLTNPDFVIFVEVKKKAYVYSEKIRGLGGMPAGVSGKVLSLISGGIDSPVASWMLMKRGCSVDFVHFYSDRKSVKKARNLVSRLREYSPGSLNLYSVPFRKALEGISKGCEERMTCVLCKRLMYKSSETLAEKIKAKALVTGENLAQVASQTLDNLLANIDAVSLPILRPLIGMDKEETISIAKKIGTYEVSVKGSDMCEYVPKKPATMAKSYFILGEEKKIKNIKTLIKNIINKKERIVI